MYIVKGFAFHHTKEDEVIPMKLSDMLAEPFKVNNYKEGHECFEGVLYYMFLLSLIKEKEETE